jgi:spore coat polysaccharide biosynthesis protein SpsF
MTRYHNFCFSMFWNRIWYIARLIELRLMWAPFRTSANWITERMPPAEPKIVATLEARMTSTRLPGKVLKSILDKPVLELMIERLRRVPSLSSIVLATTTNSTDDPVAELAHKMDIEVWRGSENDVLGRVADAATAVDADIVVETTGDCPLIDPEVVECSIQDFLSGGADCVSNAFVPTYPLGMDHYVVRAETLRVAARESTDSRDREHVIRFVLRQPERFHLRNLVAPSALHRPNLFLTLDYIEDFELIQIIFERLYPENPMFDIDEILALVDGEPGLADLNAHVRGLRV